MADEITVRSSLTIRYSNQYYQSQPGQFTADATGVRGPSPGVVSASLTGTDVSFAALAVPTWCVFTNLDSTNYVDVGAYEPSTGVFYPLLELGPGEQYVVKLSRNLGEQWSGSVTGTGTDATDNTIRVRANTAACDVKVEAFEA